MSVQIPRGATTNVVFDRTASGSPYPTSPYFMSFPSGWSGSMVSGVYSDASVTVAVSVPGNASLGNAGTLRVGLNAPDNSEGVDFAQDIEVIEGPCTCTPVATPSAGSRGPSNYVLNVELAVGDCVGPLTDIVWTPTPTSGQGTLTAVYNGRQYNQVYTGDVTATDDDGCEASAEFSFILGPGVNPPSCQR